MFLRKKAWLFSTVLANLLVKSGEGRQGRCLQAVEARREIGHQNILNTMNTMNTDTMNRLQTFAKD